MGGALVRLSEGPSTQRGIIRRGRRIAVCPEWRNSFEAFYNDIGARPSPNMSLKRINDDQGYVLGNVRWASKSEQGRNQRRRAAAEVLRGPTLHPVAGDS
jgi:hypothetical protein